MKRINKIGQAGFSLIELMVVVAIIGILAAVAIPNFQSFIVKSKQAEAKTALGSLHACEASFFAEWNRYFADFRDIGFRPEGRLNYRVGFSAAGPVAPVAPYTGSTPAAGAATQFATNNALVCGAALPCVENPATVQALPAAVVNAAANAFVAAASANLDSDATLDQWTITQQKVLAIVGANNDVN